MAVKSSNKMLPIIVGMLFLVLFIVFSKSGGDSNTTELSSYPEAGSPEADTPAATIRTLTASVAELTRNNQQLTIETKRLLSQQEAVENNVLSRLRGEINTNNSSSSPLYEDLLSKYSDLEQRMGAIGSNDIPVGVGLDELSVSLDEDEWVEPASYKPTDKEYSLPTRFTGSIPTEGYLKPSSLSQLIEEEPDSIPRYTVPRNSTLIGSVSMTALVGRVPTDGTVEDPYPFKVIVGKENLAANGLEIPGIKSMIFSGKAIGDWTLSCVRGQMDSVTYVFEDGTIRTLSSDDESLKSSSSSGSKKGEQSLAWISDERGIPCVTGKRISNATSFLLARIAAKGFEAGAKAVANAETTTTVSDVTGTAATNVTGDALKNAGFETLAGGASELGEWLEERQSQTYDVIYVDTGVKLALHIDIELPIDYETKGRKLSYASQSKISYSTTLD